MIVGGDDVVGAVVVGNGGDVIVAGVVCGGDVMVGAVVVGCCW